MEKEIKVIAITNAPTPTTVQQVESFLGIINYYGKFIPNLSTVAVPLNWLRQKEAPWKCRSDEEKNAFQKLNEALVSAKVLVHYDPKLPVKLNCDASSMQGIGTVFHMYFMMEQRSQFHLPQELSLKLKRITHK